MKRTLFSILVSFGLAIVSRADTFTVTNTQDSGVGSLREAITAANLLPGSDEIDFNIPASDPNCDPTTHVCTITLESGLPHVTDTIFLNGYSQPGASGNTQLHGTNANLLIQITADSDRQTFFNGFDVSAGNCVFRGLVLTNFITTAIHLNGAEASNTIIAGCFIGVLPDGETVLRNDNGITIFGGSHDNIVGGLSLADRNIIVSALEFGGQYDYDFGGVYISDPGSDNNQVLNNLIGLKRSGDEVLGSIYPPYSYNGPGVRIENGAQNNHVGGTAPGSGNAISGNHDNVDVLDPSTTGNIIEGNLVGTNAAGTAIVSDIGAGVYLSDSTSNTVGGLTPASRNIIAGVEWGVYIFGGDDNLIVGNYIGTDITGSVALTVGWGIEIEGGSGNVIGGSGGAGNVIASATDGIRIFEGVDYDPVLHTIYRATDNMVIGNRIGVGPNGSPLPNLYYGVRISAEDALNNMIGGLHEGEGNLIAFNGEGGIILTSPNSTQDPTSSGNAFLGNSIYENDGPGITVSPTNDDCDLDGGPNNGQNFPVLTSAVSSASGTHVTGRLNSTSNTQFVIEFFANPACDDSGYGEGKTFLGRTTVTTKSNCNATIDVNLPAVGLNGQYMTATATDSANNSSSFSACLPIGLPAPSPTPSPQPSSTPNPSATPNPSVTPTPTASPQPSATPTPAPVITPTPTATPMVVQLANISGRAFAQPNDQVSICGFIIRGGAGKKVIVRALGPSLRVGGMPVSGAMQNPSLELYNGSGALLAADDNWRQSQEAEIKATELAPTDNREAAIVATLAPGSYTAVLNGAHNSGGVALVEVYDLQSLDGKLANVSVRGNVLTDDNVLINGVILRGGAPRKVLFRAIGPSLHQAGLTGELEDPVLDIYDGNGELLGSNDNWRDSAQATAIKNSGLAPNDDRESALLLTLPAAGYTAIVRGANRTTGIAVAEAYQLE